MGVFAQFLAALATLSVVSFVAAIPAGNMTRGDMSVKDLTPAYPYDPNTHPGCTYWWDNDGDVPCADLVGFGITIEALLAWNPSLTPECGNFIVGRSYCVEVRGWEPPSTTTSGGPSPTDGSGGIKTPQPTQPDMVDNCNKFDFVDRGDNCASLTKDNGITVDKFIEWNPSVEKDCTKLWANVNVCVGVIGFEPPTTTKPPTSTTAPGNGVKTPEPTQPGMVDNCEVFDFVAKGDTCASITKRNGITLAQLVQWNPSIEDDCTGLWLNVNVCVKTIGFQAPTTTNKPPTTTAGPGNGVETKEPIMPGMVDNCNKFHIVGKTTTCQGIVDYNKISMADFIKWNPMVGEKCDLLWLDHYMCVGVIGGSSPPTTTQPPANGITTPLPIQSGMVSNCNKFHEIKSTTTCANLLAYHSISLADLFKWNPAVRSDCSGLLVGTNACVGVIGGSSPPVTTAPPANGITTPQPIQTGMVTNCNKFHEIKSTTTCANLLAYHGISMADLYKWNPAVKSDCSGLLVGTNACVGVIGGSSPPVTTAPPANGVTTPQPIQTGMVTNCNKFHEIKSTTTCANLLAYHSITMSELYKWNPAVKSDCSNLQPGTNVCVGVIGGSPPTTTKPPANGISTPQPIQTGMVTNCNLFHEIKSTTTCAALLDYRKITMAQLYAWNPAVKSDCSNLQPGTNVCVGVIGGSPPTTTKPPANGVTTPLPIQTGMVTNCNKFHEIKSTTTCANLLAYHSIAMSDLYKWNPAVKSDCSNLQPGTNVCVGVIGSSTTKPPSNGVTTPLPIQTGMVTNCKTFHQISSTTTCAALLEYRKITMAQLYKWNPAVKSDCSNLQIGTNVCVAVLS